MDKPEEPTPAQWRTIKWKHDVEQERYRKPTTPRKWKTPASVPPTARRLMVLLAWIGSGDGKMVLATKRCPPLTPDMKTLIAKGYCRLERNFPVLYPERLAAQYRRSTVQRVTRICITEAGRKALDKVDIPDEDYDYLKAAMQTMTLL